jgi:hypothetical protein
MADIIKLLPKSDIVSKPDGRNGAFHLVRYFLSDNMDSSAKKDLKEGVDSWSRMSADLIVIDIVAGEPPWLENVLRHYDGFGAPLHIVGRPCENTIAALKRARTGNSEHIAMLLGYRSIG